MFVRDAQVESKLDRAVKDEIGRTGERDLMKLVAVAFEIDLQGIAAAHQDLDRTVETFPWRKNQRARHDAGAAGEGLVLDPALVGANRDPCGPALLD